MPNFKFKKSDKILDIGGAMKQRTDCQVDTLLDIIHPQNAPYGPTKLLAKNFIKVDLMREKLPFKDKEFDFCFCTHTLEDLPYPFGVIEEMQRVAKRGYIATPAMGQDIIFSNINFTDWVTGARRVPGHSHHKWLFFVKNGVLQVLPKNYGVLYSSNFHFTKWLGSPETEFYWEGKIKYKEVKDLDIHLLIREYRKYINANKNNLVKGTPLIYFDKPIWYVKELVKFFLMKGEGFNR